MSNNLRSIHLESVIIGHAIHAKHIRQAPKGIKTHMLCLDFLALIFDIIVVT